MKTNLFSFDDLLEILRQLVAEFDDCSSLSHCNERYLHHFFSHRLQAKCPIAFDGKSLLHPEWATAIDRTTHRAKYKYKDADKRYEVNQDAGTSGFIDFAIGDYDKPDYAIEFKMSTTFSSKGVEYDYLKLLDTRNAFAKSISIVVLYGRSTQSKIIYAKHFKDCVTNAISRLKKESIPVRDDFAFYVLEHFKGKTIIHCCNTEDGLFSKIESL